MKTRLLIIATLVLFSSMFLISEADALIESLSLKDLVEKAEFVVIGEVIELSPLIPVYLLPFTDGYDRLQFDVTLSVDNDLDGKYGQDIIVFRIQDSREDFGMYVEDAQNFEIGERVLVFIGEKEPDSIMGDAYIVYGVTQGKYLLQDGIAFGSNLPEGIDEGELVLKIKNMRGVNADIELDCFLTEYWNGVKCVPYEDEPFCGLGTELVDDACIVVNPKLDPMLTPMRDYDYGLIYMIILAIVGIISGVVGGVIFMIMRKRK